MKVLWIILGALGALLLLLILLLLFGRAKIRIAASASRVKVMLSVLGFRIWILPTNKGILKDGKDSKLIQKLQTNSKKKKEMKKAKRDAGEPVPNLLENLQMVAALLKAVRAKLKHKLRIRVRLFRVEVAAPDAAQTAILYGATVGACSLLWEWIQANVAEVDRRRGAMSVTPNYLKTQSNAEIDFVIKIHALKALFIVFDIINVSKTEAQKAEQKAALRQEKAKQHASANV